jgi:hypothetical protein
MQDPHSVASNTCRQKVVKENPKIITGKRFQEGRGGVSMGQELPPAQRTEKIDDYVKQHPGNDPKHTDLFQALLERLEFDI